MKRTVIFFFLAFLFCLCSAALSIAKDCGRITATFPAQYVPLPPVNFVEEWDNGLTGNHPWLHHATDSENGTSENYMAEGTEGVLVKDNLRYTGYDSARYNVSYLDLKYDDHPNGIPINSDTWLEFKIDELWINAFPPAPSGDTTQFQYFALIFNNNFRMQFSQDGQFVSWDDPSLGRYFNAGYYSFDLGANMSGNIHQLFQGLGFELPYPLFLEEIVYLQQLWDLEEPSETEHRQIMKVDYIRVIQEEDLD